MSCARGCCPTPADHYRSIGVRPRPPAAQQTVDHTDQTVNTVTEHWDDRTDVHVRVADPVTARRPDGP